MVESSRNTQHSLAMEHNKGSLESDDQAQISPKSLEGFQNIESGISKLVDEVPSPQPEEGRLEQQMNNMTISGYGQYHGNYDPSGRTGYFNNAQDIQVNFLRFTGPQNYIGQDLSAGTPYFPGQMMENQERLQGMAPGVVDFQHSMPQMSKPHSGQYSRQSSDGEGMGYLNRGDFSEKAVFSGAPSYKADDNFSNQSWAGSQSDYQEQINEQVQKFSYIFQSPDINSQNFKKGQPSYNSAFQSQGYFNNPQWEGYHQIQKPSQGFQQRASSFDKVNNQNTHINSQNQYPYNNDELETHSAASSDNKSAFSEGDVQNPIYHTPNNYTPHMHNPYGHMVPSNQASYGFTPNIQFSNSNQKYHHSSGYQMNYSNEGLPYSHLADDSTPFGNSPYGHNDIQISEQDVSLHKMPVGASPRRNSNEFKPTQKLINSNQTPTNLMYSHDKSHGQAHSQYKTPSPYRNSEHGIQHNQQIGFNQRNIRYDDVQNQMPGQYYQQQQQAYNFQNQRIANSQSHQSRPFYPAGRGQMTDHAHIGINAPPMTRGLVFQNQEQHFIHGGPMVAIQPNMHQNFQPHFNNMNQAFHVQAPFRGQYRSNVTGSQERELGYQPANFIPPPIQNAHIASRSGFNTPTHHHASDARSASSQNSAGDAGDQPYLQQLIKQYGECQNTTQKQDILKGNVHKLALTQRGSRFLQKEIQKSSPNTVQFFLDELSPHLSELMVDNYGNYFCQNLLGSCTSDQRLTILKSIGNNFINICCDKKGTHTIQKMLELVNLQDEEDFIRDALKGRIIELAKVIFQQLCFQNGQGTHVVQKVLGSFSNQRKDFIFEEVYDQFIDLAKDSNGLCVIKKIIQITKNPDQVDMLMKKIQSNAIDLVQDAFGNYAINEVILKWEPEVCYPVFKALKEKIGQLSSQKYSSNVIEKCFERADESMRSQLLIELAKSDRLSSLIRNQYGNFVVQKALKISSGAEKEQLIHFIRKCIPDITDKKIKERWEKIVYDAENGTNTANQSTANDNTSQGSNYHDQDNIETLRKDNIRANSSDNVAQ